jgi:hypothetical protein
MASTMLYVQGKGSWIKAIQPNQWDKWSMTLHPTQESLEKLRELQGKGMKNTIKKDDDGWFINFSRPVSRIIKGKIQTMAPPVVMDKDNKPLEGTKIGNGSDVTVKLEVYEHSTPGGGKAIAARWESVRIDNLIPFNPDTDYPDDMKEQASGLKDQPEQLF